MKTIFITPRSGYFGIAAKLIESLVPAAERVWFKSRPNPVFPILLEVEDQVIRFDKRSNIEAQIRLYAIKLSSFVKDPIAIKVGCDHIAAGDQIFLAHFLSLTQSTMTLEGMRRNYELEMKPTSKFDHYQCLLNNNPWPIRDTAQRLCHGDLKDFEWSTMIARSLVMLDDPRGALASLSEAEGTDNLSKAKILYEKAMLFARHLPPAQRDVDRAENLLAQAQELVANLGPEDNLEKALLHNAESLIFILQGDYVQGVNSERLAYEILVDSLENGNSISKREEAIIRANLGRALFAAGSPEDGIDHLRAAADLEPEFSPHYSDLFEALINSGREEEAFKISEEVAEAAAESFQASVLMGNLYSSFQRPEEAVGWYKNAIFLQPEFEDVKMQCAQEMILAGNLREALALIGEVDSSFLTRDDKCRLALLEIEATSLLNECSDPNDMLKKLQKLKEEYPATELLLDNIKMLESLVG